MIESTLKRVSTTRVSYWQVFRLIFVIFSLFLLGDAFYRWDGFRYYASFSEFLPSVALATILWSIVAVFTALIVWLLLRALEWFCQRIGLKIRIEHLLLFIGFFMLLGVIAWIGKRLIWHGGMALTLQERRVVFLSVIFVAIFLTWLFRDKLGIIHEGVTPLVWLFGIWVMLSVPLVAYHTWIKQTDNVVSQKISQSSILDKSKPNIILVTFDALTARNMSVYGYHRLTTPFITEWAKTASLFTMAEAEGTHTAPTTASLMTGKRLWTHQLYHPHGYMSFRENIENLPLLLKNDGYYNMAFIVNTYASVERLGISNSFEIAHPFIVFRTPNSLREVIDFALYQLFGEKIRLYNWVIKGDSILNRVVISRISRDFSKTGSPPEKAFNKFLKNINNNPPKPFFAWIHLMPPHDPYLPPEPYIGMFDSSPELRTFKSRWNIKHKQQKKKQISILKARYDEFIRYCDKQFEDFITQLKKRNKLKNTVIILSSDHGEVFGPTRVGHGGGYLIEPLTHIPLIIKEPNQTEGRIINELVEQIDIPATILDLVNIPVPSWMEGRSLVPLMREKKLLPKPAFSMALGRQLSRGHEITKGTIAVWEGDYKLIHYLKDEKSFLFNLKEDPDELNNLYDKKPEINQHLLNIIQENLKLANVRISRGE